MKQTPHSRFLIALSLAALAWTAAPSRAAAPAPGAASPTASVNPFVGTAGHGHTYPGATVPFGLVQLSPDTRTEGWDGCSGYHYDDTTIQGFSHTHLTGTGAADLGDVLLMPTVGRGSPGGRHARRRAMSRASPTPAKRRTPAITVSFWRTRRSRRS